jgi:hypothetical protein
MTLNDLVGGGREVSLALIGADAALATQVQERLAAHGVLDPPADGSFGLVSLWAMGQFLRKVGTPGKTTLDAEAARALLAAEPAFALRAPASLAGRIVRATQAAGHWLNRHPDCVNIVYVEGMDEDGTPNVDAPNVFRIAFGQYKAWSVGTHMAGRPSAHEALVQTVPIRVHRDLNQDFERNDDQVFEGLFGVNQHWGFDLPKADIGRASAGCLVGRTKAGHRAFMALCKADPRFAANNGYRFLTTVLPAGDVPAATA